MKIISFILCVTLLSCGSPQTNIPNDILSENIFIDLLKDIHLAEAKFELHKTKGMENAKNELAHNYSAIYETHEITADDFDKTLDYYAQHPEQLEKIYTRVLEQLTKDKTILDQQ
jgi:ferritin-like metal-binding protein YciE